MPLYEYVTDDGTRVELMRSMKDADKPVEDPDGKGRVFKRTLSIFSSGGGSAGGSAGASAGGHVHSGTCGCGKRAGSCGM